MNLNLGSGTDYREGWVNVDSGNVKCDVKHDIEVFPWPFEDNSVDEVLMQHIMEHVDRSNFVGVVRELYRVCKDGAFIVIHSPHALSNNFYTDPTHKMPLTERTFDYFDDGKELRVNGLAYGWDDVHFNVVNALLLPNPPNGPDVIHHIVVQK